MIESGFNLCISLRIVTDEELELVSRILNTEPTDTAKKGERKFKTSPVTKSNIWMYAKKYERCKEIGDRIIDFVKSIPEFHEKMETLKEIGNISFGISVVSVFGQIGFSLSEKDIEVLNLLKIPFDISIFSWGQCVDE